MKKFLIKILLFVLPILLIAIPLDFFISKNLKKSTTHAYGEYLVWNDIYSGQIDADIAIYGSSRSWVHISPEILEDSLNMSAYNFGIDALNFKFQYFRHQQLLKYNKKPKMIIVSGDIFSFEKEEEFYNHEQILPYMLWNKDYYKNRKIFNGYNTLDFIIPLIRYTGKTQELIHAFKLSANIKNPHPMRIKGYMGMQRTWNSDLEKAKKEHGSLKIKIDQDLLNLFDKFLIECKNNDIEVILVYSPEYIEGQTFIENRDEIMNLWEGFSEKHNILYLDYTQDSMCYNRDYFYNATHLNKNGSEIFSAKLAEDIKTLRGR
ncbi:MAG: hypothetical protein C0596_04235 [Marinilabiliales bacterium]|nr:MAG: hypothetical protein C0596_04235 [Marinilabiliales bacterium]